MVPVLVAFIVAGCAANGGMTETGKGAVLGGGGGAAIGAILDAGNPLAGAIIGAAGGALIGAATGHFMDQRKQDLEKTLAPEINAGQAQVQILKDNSLLVSMTQQTAFAPQSAVINPGFLSTLQKIADVEHLRQDVDRRDRATRSPGHPRGAPEARGPARRGGADPASRHEGPAGARYGHGQPEQPVHGRPCGTDPDAHRFGLTRIYREQKSSKRQGRLLPR